MGIPPVFDLTAKILSLSALLIWAERHSNKRPLKNLEPQTRGIQREVLRLEKVFHQNTLNSFHDPIFDTDGNAWHYPFFLRPKHQWHRTKPWRGLVPLRE
jgi:hypothetical protein